MIGMIRTIKAIIFVARWTAYACIVGLFVFLITGLVDPDNFPNDNMKIVFTDQDTTISKAHLIELKQCSEELENNQFIIYTMNKAIRTKDNAITSLQKENRKLNYQIKQHNAKVKNPKSKYWIDTGTN